MVLESTQAVNASLRKAGKDRDKAVKDLEARKQAALEGALERARQRMAHDVEMMRQDHNREMEEIRSQLQEAVIKAVQRGEQEKRTAVESMQVRRLMYMYIY